MQVSGKTSTDFKIDLGKNLEVKSTGVTVDAKTDTGNNVKINDATKIETFEVNLNAPAKIEESKASAPEVNVNTQTQYQASSSGQVLNSRLGTVQGPSGKETYYNLNMGGVVREAQPGGFIYAEAEKNGYANNLSSNVWVRDDGVKMMGDYIMVAADLNVHPRGSIVQTTLGPGVVVDTGTFAETNHEQIDIAVTWR